MAISWKRSQMAQIWPTRKNWGCFQHLENFLSPGTQTVCSIDFENFIPLNPGRSSFCSSWQSCRSRLILQLCQLHHVLIRSGLGVIRCQSSSVSRPSFCLNRNGAHRRGRPAAEQRRHLSSIRRSWPRLSAPACAWHPRCRPERSGRVHFLSASPLSPKERRSELTVASSLRRARVRSSLRLSPPNSTHSSAVSRSSLPTL